MTSVRFNAAESGAIPARNRTTRTLPETPVAQPRSKQNILQTKATENDPWILFYTAVTCCFPPFILRTVGGMKKVVRANGTETIENDVPTQKAWREKFALCLISACLCATLGYITFWLQRSLCPATTAKFKYREMLSTNAPINHVIVHGKVYDMSSFLTEHAAIPYFRDGPPEAIDLISNARGVDISPFFQSEILECRQVITTEFPVQCKDDTNFPNIVGCHTKAEQALVKTLKGPLYLEWSDITGPNLQYIVFNNKVVNLEKYFALQKPIFGDQIDQVLRRFIGRDATLALQTVPSGSKAGRCLSSIFDVGDLDSETVGCFSAQVFLMISLIIIGSLIIVKFVLALGFSWFMSHQLGDLAKNRAKKEPRRRDEILMGEFKMTMNDKSGVLRTKNSKVAPMLVQPVNENMRSQSAYGDELYTLMLVTCYSESEKELRNTFESLALTCYNEDYKVLFVVADGMVTGKGNSLSTPDICLSLLDLDPNWPHPGAFPYQAVASGSMELNFAKVYVAWFHHNGRSVPTILVVKTGAPDEQTKAKPGNRGKRDSQIMLMRFLQRITLNERLCPFEYDLFQKLHFLMGVTPDHFEIVLMVDADTKVAPDSVARMVACMSRDPLIMGLCGETRIANKTDSYITRIQVFEYYLSHHLTKAFESIFGGVTCLPGCFSMYRIKCPKDGKWVPILAAPEIVDIYSQSVADTLHKKNLLLLGEDRFLTTMMLRQFPRRKLMFVPKAYCKTTVPHTFRMLLSQRRRWINSTIHNLMELLLVGELCGTFCFSMQFAIFLELIGTVTLPAAIVFTGVLITVSVIGEPQIVPLILLAGVLGLPAVLILFTTKRVIYVYWLLVYLTALPIWNFVLPLYAFWHFDDFSWGETRKVVGETKQGHGADDGIRATSIPLKRWEEWERERRQLLVAQLARGRNV